MQATLKQHGLVLLQMCLFGAHACCLQEVAGFRNECRVIVQFDVLIQFDMKLNVS